MSGAGTEDWERCRDWLAEASPVSARPVSQVTAAWELYSYLKDGTELCRIVGFLTKGKVPEEILYRTQNISNLEENNVALALSIIDQEIVKKHKIKISFGPRKEKAFESYDNFHAVLKGLSELSRYFEKTSLVRGFSLVGRRKTKTKSEKLLRKDTTKEYYHYNVEDEDDTKYEKEEDYIDFMNERESLKARDLREAINELINHNLEFIEDVLENLLNNFQKKLPVGNILSQKLFPHLKIKEILAIHKDLARDLEILPVSYIEIGNIFANFQDRYLVFCSVTALNDLMREFLADQMANNEKLRKLVQHLQTEAEVKFVKKKWNLSDLLTRLACHPVRVRMLLSAIMGYARREKLPDVTAEAKRAFLIMDNIGHHLNKYSEDYQYIEAMRNLKNTIREFPDEELHHFGFRVVNEFSEVEMLSLDNTDTDTDKFKKYQLIVFHQYFLTVEHFKDKKITYCFFWPTIKKIRYRRFSQNYNIADFHQISQPFKNGKSKYFLVEMRGEGSKSLVFRFSRETEAKMFTDLFDNLKKKVHSEIASNGFHRDHDKEKFREEIPDDSYEKHLKCGSCNNFLLGKLQYGIHCLTCQKVYHKKCFMTDPSSDDDDDEEEVDETDETLPHSRIVPMTNLDDLYIGTASRKESEDLLDKTAVGSFHLRFSGKKQHYVISRRLESSSDHITVNWVMVGATGYYSIRLGHGRRSLLEMIEANRAHHQLLTPVVRESRRLGSI